MTIDTARLRLHAYAPEHLLALIEGPEAFEKCFGLRAAAGLREFIVSDEVSPDWLAQLRASTTADPWVHGFAVVHRETRSVIGTAAFKGPPNEDGKVEIAYGIVPAFEGQGYATEAASALVAYAADSGRARLVRAHTLPEANASTRVLEKCGFLWVGEVVDPEDGPVWRWERGPVDGATAERAMPSEQDAHEELQYYTLAHRDPGFIHQYVVDAWAAQHADERTKPIALTFALVGLYLHVEKRFSGKQVQRAHMALARRKRGWPPFALPTERGSMTAIDVVAAPAGPDRDKAIEAWCASVWRAFRESHQVVADLLEQHSIV